MAPKKADENIISCLPARASGFHYRQKQAKQQTNNPLFFTTTVRVGNQWNFSVPAAKQ
jgi:hypothetical protein